MQSVLGEALGDRGADAARSSGDERDSFFGHGFPPPVLFNASALARLSIASLRLMRLASPASVRPGASSTNRASPAPISTCIVCSHFTGETICCTSKLLIDAISVCGCAVTLEYTAARGGLNVTLSNSPRIRSAADCMIGL